MDLFIHHVNNIYKAVQFAIIFITLVGSFGCTPKAEISSDADQYSKDSLIRITDSLEKLVLDLRSDTIMNAKEIFDAYASSTVTILTPQGSGTGFYITENLIVTNYHVIADNTTLMFKPYNSDQTYPFDGYVAVDKVKDLVILSTSNIYGTPLEMANDMVSPGDPVYVIGNPMGLQASVSDGIVAGIRQNNFNQYVQITAPISHGNSGGPVFNSRGQVIGVSKFYIEGGQNLNFAIPYLHIETMLNFKSTYPMAFSNLVDQQDENENSTASGKKGFGVNNTWFDSDRTAIIKSCLKSYSEDYPEISAADGFSFCNCLFDYLSSNYERNSDAELTDYDKQQLRDLCIEN